jgi:hypothetical protein
VVIVTMVIVTMAIVGEVVVGVGIGVAAAEWLIARNPMLLGADNWPVEVSPNPDPKLSLPVHQVALVDGAQPVALE